MFVCCVCVCEGRGGGRSCDSLVTNADSLGSVEESPRRLLILFCPHGFVGREQVLFAKVKKKKTSNPDSSFRQ